MMTPAQQHISVEVYLRTSYTPDAEYVNGAIIERSSGAFEHSEWQAAIITWFRSHAAEWKLWPQPGYRIRVNPTVYRVPDVTLVDEGQDLDEYLITVPFGIIEILTPDDPWTKVTRKAREYSTLGVPHIWFIDPPEGQIWRYLDGSFIPDQAFTARERGIHFAWKDLAATARGIPSGW